MPKRKQSTHEQAGAEPKLLSGGNPQIPKGEGDAPVQTYIAATHEEVRYLDIHEDDDLDEDQLVSWIEQASRLPGEHL